MPTVEELKQQLAEAEATEAAEVKEAAANPIVDQIKASPHESFIEALREVAGRMQGAGEILESDLIGDAESKPMLATLLKLIGELVK